MDEGEALRNNVTTSCQMVVAYMILETYVYKTIAFFWKAPALCTNRLMHMPWL